MLKAGELSERFENLAVLVFCELTGIFILLLECNLAMEAILSALSGGYINLLRMIIMDLPSTLKAYFFVGTVLVITPVSIWFVKHPTAFCITLCVLISVLGIASKNPLLALLHILVSAIGFVLSLVYVADVIKTA